MPGRSQPQESLYSAEMRRAAVVSLVLVGGAAAALALASYLAKQQRGERVALGTGASAAETWLRDTAARLEQGSQALIERVDSKN